jgi:hypothetical protein
VTPRRWSRPTAQQVLPALVEHVTVQQAPTDTEERKARVRRATESYLRRNRKASR